MKIERKWWATMIANRRSREIHRIDRMTSRCHPERMNRVNVIYCTRIWAWLLIRFGGYNGCRWCRPEKDNG